MLCFQKYIYICNIKPISVIILKAFRACLTIGTSSHIPTVVCTTGTVWLWQYDNKWEHSFPTEERILWER